MDITGTPMLFLAGEAIAYFIILLIIEKVISSQFISEDGDGDTYPISSSRFCI
jgi:hypothetical protein